MSRQLFILILMSKKPTVLIALLGLSIGLPAGAQNLVINAEFDFDTSHWEAQDSSIEMIFRNDMASTLPGASGAGVLEVQRTDFIGGSSGVFQTITGVEEGKTYEIAGSLFFPSENNPAETGDILVFWNDGAGGLVDYDFISMYPLPHDTWVRLSDTLTAPIGTVSADIRLTIDNPASDTETRPGITIWDDIWMSEAGSDEAVQRLFVPAAASIDGLGGTFWSTTGWFSNTIDYPLTLWGTFLPPDTDNTARLLSLTQLSIIPARGFVTIENLVGELGENDVAGGLYLEARASAVGLPAVIATGTTHTFTPNPSGDGVYGQGLPAVGPGELSRVVIPGLFKNSSFRTNVGLLNTSGETLTVLVEIYDDSGTRLGSDSWTLLPYAQKQTSLNAFGVTTLTGGTVVITRQSDGGSFRAYTSTVDQKSGDAIYNPGQ